VAAVLIATAGLLLLVRPPSATSPVRRGWQRWSSRWVGRSPTGQRAVVVPAAETALTAVGVGVLASRTVVVAVPDTPASARGLLVALIALALLTPAAMPGWRVIRYRVDGRAATVLVPCASITIPLALAQLRAVDTTHIEVIGRLVPWWAAMVVGVLIALRGAAGAVGVQSRPAYVAVLATAAVTGVAIVIWSLVHHPVPGPPAWALLTTPVRVALVACAVVAVLPVAAVRAHGRLRRLAISTALVGAAASLLLVTWWVGWTSWPDAWIRFHLPTDFTPWWRDTRNPGAGG
jgi:hypothetical protein